MLQEFRIEGIEEREYLRIEETEDHERVKIAVDLGDAFAAICLDVYAWNRLMTLGGKLDIHVPMKEVGE